MSFIGESQSINLAGNLNGGALLVLKLSALLSEIRCNFPDAGSFFHAGTCAKIFKSVVFDLSPISSGPRMLVTGTASSGGHGTGAAEHGV